MQDQLVPADLLFFQGFANELLGQGGRLSFGQHPADDIAAEDVEDDVKVVVGPLGGSEQFGDVPGPDLVGSDGQELGFLVLGVAQLVAPFAQLSFALEEAVHGAFRAEVNPFIEQRGVDLAGSAIHEPVTVEHGQDLLAFFGAQGQSRGRRRASRSRADRPLPAGAIQRSSRHAQGAAGPLKANFARQLFHSVQKFLFSLSSFGASWMPRISETFFAPR